MYTISELVPATLHTKSVNQCRHSLPTHPTPVSTPLLRRVPPPPPTPTPAPATARPTPKVDAALDAANVARVAHYIRQRTRGGAAASHGGAAAAAAGGGGGGPEEGGGDGAEGAAGGFQSIVISLKVGLACICLCLCLGLPGAPQ